MLYLDMVMMMWVKLRLMSARAGETQTCPLASDNHETGIPGKTAL